MSNNIYDLVIIGSSPHLLLIANIYSKFYNYSVLLLEKSPTFGGHWSPSKFRGFTIDNGPHLFYNFNSDMKYLFNSLKSIAELDFRIVDPPPRSDLLFFSHLCELSFLINKKYSFHYFMMIFRAFVLVPFFKFSNYAYFAPRGGSRKMISDLLISLKSCGGVALSNTKVNSLAHYADHREEHNLVKVITSADKVFLARRVIASSSYCLNATQSSPSKTRYLHQIYVLVDSAASNFSFFRCFRKTSFYLISDLTPTASPLLPPNTLILSGNLKKDVIPNDSHSIELINFLLGNRLISHSNGILNIVDFKFNSIPSSRASSSDIQYVESLSQLITIYHCQNLVRSLASVLDSIKY